MSITTTPSYQLYVGVDISARTFSAALLNPESQAEKTEDFTQTLEGYQSFQIKLLTRQPIPAKILIVMEATGTYWVTLATVLEQKGFVVSVVNPMQARNFIRSLPRQAKNDQLDAQGLARLAQALKPAGWVPPPEIYQQLQQRLTQRVSLLDLRQQVKNQLHALSRLPNIVEAVVERMHELISTFDRQLSQLETEIEELTQQENEWSKTIALLQTIPGIGQLTACVVVVYTLNFSLCKSAEQASHYAGLAPMEKSSGTSVRGRARIGPAGHSRLRTALYLATLSGAQHNAVLKEFYERLRATGKPAKVARCATARKLLHLAYAVATSGQAFDPEYATRKKKTKQAAAA
jgi:transposase